MKRVVSTCKLGVCLLVLATALVTDVLPTAFAATPPPPTTIIVQQTPPPSQAPNFIVTSLIGSVLPDYIELYNQGDTPLYLDTWNVGIRTHDQTFPGGCGDLTHYVALPPTWLLPKKYFTLQRNAPANPASPTFSFAMDSIKDLPGCLTPQLSSITLVHGLEDPEQTVSPGGTLWSSTTLSAVQHKQRNNSPTSTRTITGDFATDYKSVLNTNVALNSDPTYSPPSDDASLQILEILPNARSCSPSEVDSTCNDYVKLYNPTDQPINLARYRLRIGYKGQSESVTNTFTWGKDLDPATTELLLPAHEYFMLTSRNDGQPISITDTGNYVWLEDAYGAVMYDLIVQYPDASSTTKVGQAWAYDGTTWQWTSQPQPGAANYFPFLTVAPPTDSGITITSVTSEPKPCAPDQYRNPDTNRCKLLVVGTTSLQPCEAGQERNPETNRCRLSVSTANSLAPCQAGSERNPDTNRCRKVGTVAGASTTAVKDVTAPSINNTGWFVAGLALCLALGYAVYEWRQDIGLATSKLVNSIFSLPSRRHS